MLSNATERSLVEMPFSHMTSEGFRSCPLAQLIGRLQYGPLKQPLIGASAEEKQLIEDRGRVPDEALILHTEHHFSH